MAADEKSTEFFEDMRWLPPVETAAELPVETARDGHLCFVNQETAVYRFADGVWQVEATAD